MRAILLVPLLVAALASPCFADGLSGGGTGNVNGPSSSTANHVATYADTTGKLIQDGGALPASANPTASCGPSAVNGTATTFMTSDSAPACQKGTNAQFGLVEGDGTSVLCVVGVCSIAPSVALAPAVPSTGIFTAGSGDGTTPTLTGNTYGMTVDFGAAGTGGVLRYATATMPTAPWTVKVGAQFNYVQRAFRQPGICISDGTKFYTFNYIGENNSGSDVAAFLEVQSWTNKTTFGSVLQHDTYYPPVYLAISYAVGTGVTFSHSNDGRNYIPFYVVGSPAFTPTVAGLCFNPDGTDHTVTGDHAITNVYYWATSSP